MSNATDLPHSEAARERELDGAAAPAAATNRLLVAGGILLVIGALYVGQEIFIPFALASLLAFALSPVVLWLRRRGLPRGIAVLLTVAGAFAAILGLLYLVASQAVDLVTTLSVHRETLARKIGELSNAGQGEGWLGEMRENLESLRTVLLAQMSEQIPAAIPVVIAQPNAGPLAVLGEWVGPFVRPLATAGIALVLLVIFLANREDLRDRFIKLVSAGDLRTSTAAIDEATRRVSRYLLMQLIVNTSYGALFSGALLLIGVPGALLWGILAGILRFVPIVGTYIAVIFPLALAFAIDPGWQMFVIVAIVFVCLDVAFDYVIDPMLFSSSTGLSTLAIIVAAIFWTTVWGFVGLLLSVPLSVCIIVLGRHVSHLSFFDTVLGSESALLPEEKLFQRLLAGNLEEAIELGEKEVETTSLAEFYDGVAVRTLRLAERDRVLGKGEVQTRRLVAEEMIVVAREAAAYAVTRARRQPAEEEAHPPRSVGTPVLAIGARSELDRAAAEMVGLELRNRGIDAQVLPPMAVRQHGLAQIDLRGIEVVCLCYLEDDPQPSVRFIARRLKQRSPNIQILVCLLSAPASEEHGAAIAKEASVDAVAGNIGRAALLIDNWVARHPTDAMLAPALPPNEAERLSALHRLGLTSSSGGHFDEVARKVSSAFGAPMALVTVVSEEYQHWPGAAGLPPGLDVCRMSDRETSICGHVVASDDVLVIEDVAADTRFANNPFLLEHGIRFYAGAPLRTLDGYTIGSLCILDFKPRAFAEDEKKVLIKIATSVMVTVEMNLRQAVGY